MCYRAILAVLGLLLVCPAANARPPDETDGAKQRPDPSRVLITDGSPVHDIGNLLLHNANWGMFGSMPGSGMPFSQAPSAEWPAGSGVEYLFGGGLWVGAIRNGVPAVSTTFYQFEFRPDAAPLDTIYRAAEGDPGGLRYPSPGADDDHDGRVDEEYLDGYDNDGDGLIDEDYAAISPQMFSCRYRDNTTSAQQIYPDHDPLNLAVHERSYQWDLPGYEDFVGYDYDIQNIGNEVLEDVYVGVFIDGDVGKRSTPSYWEDDATAFRQGTASTGFGDVPYNFAYTYDADGDNGTATGDFGVVVLDYPTDPTGHDAPQDVHVSGYRVFGAYSFEDDSDPTNDFERYEVLSDAVIRRDYSVPRDYRTLVSVGPFRELSPGSVLHFSMALVATPRDDLENVIAAALTYRGRTFYVNGREHQVHWWPPTQEVPGPEPMAATVRVTPRTVNLKSMGDPLKAHVTLPEGYHAADVAGATLRLNGEIHGSVETVVSDREFIARFPRKRLGEVVAPGEAELELTFIAGDQLFVATDQVRVIHGGPTTASGSGVTKLQAANSPNPFNPTTRIAFDLPRDADVTLDVYSADGALVRRLAAAAYPAGRHDVVWRGRDDSGREVASGIYFYRLRSGSEVLTRKMVLVK